jgi:hypothetical protein
MLALPNYHRTGVIYEKPQSILISSRACQANSLSWTVPHAWMPGGA